MRHCGNSNGTVYCMTFSQRGIAGQLINYQSGGEYSVREAAVTKDDALFFFFFFFFFLLHFNFFFFSTSTISLPFFFSFPGLQATSLPLIPISIHSSLLSSMTCSGTQ